MFRQLANMLGPGGVADQATAELVLTLHPSELAEYLEQCWLFRDANLFEGLPPAPAQPPGPQVPPNQGEDLIFRAMARPIPLVAPPALPVAGAVWPHLAYAFMLDSTKMFLAFRRLLEMYVTGLLRVSSWQTRNWLRTTEELFFANPRLPSVYSLESHLRPDSGARRRNAYYRLLGIELGFGTDDGKVYPYVKPDAANREFASIFETLLAEVWRGYINVTNQAGPNETDDTAIEDLLRRIYDMLTGQRLQGALSREEFEAVAHSDWLALTLDFNTQIINDLRAQGTSATERLMKIGQLVGVPLHSRTDSFFQMATPLSNILRGIESGAISGIGGAQSLYLVPGINRANMLTIIRHWSIASGRNIKELLSARGAAAPIGSPTARTLASSMASVSTNGGARRVGGPV